MFVVVYVYGWRKKVGVERSRGSWKGEREREFKRL